MDIEYLLMSIFRGVAVCSCIMIIKKIFKDN